MLRRKARIMLFKIGITCVVIVAFIAYYLGENESGTTDKSIPTVVTIDPEESERAAVQAELVEKSRTPVSTSRGDNLIHLVVVVCGDRKDEAITMIKSAILWPRRKLRIHIFAEDHLKQPIRDKFSIWSQEFRQKFDYVFYPITFPGHGENWKHLFKPCSSQRLFLPAMLSDIDAVLYVDTDVVFMRPIDDVWRHFTEFNTSHIAALSPESQDVSMGWYNRFAMHPFYGLTGVNSGVMLMNLTRMRKFGWITEVMRFYRQFKLRLTWGDQDLINIIFHHNPDKLYLYSCDWNFRPDHCMYMSNCEVAEHLGVSVLHGNRGVLHSNKQPAFRAIFDAFHAHRLGADVQYSLLDTMTANLDKATHTNCGKVGRIFTKQFEERIPDYRRRKMEWLKKQGGSVIAGGTVGTMGNVSRLVTFRELIQQKNYAISR